MTLFDLNQANYPNLPTLTEEQLNKKVPFIVDFIDKHKGKNFLVLEKEQRHYTLLTFKDGKYNPGAMARELITLINSFSEIKSIEVSTDMVEIWVIQKKWNPDTNKDEEECRMYAFFNYDAGVIEVS